MVETRPPSHVQGVFLMEFHRFSLLFVFHHSETLLLFLFYYFTSFDLKRFFQK